jgi:hypothetical protein
MDEQKDLLKNSTPSDAAIEPVPEIDIPTIRTYKSDIGGTVNKDKITTAKILMAEQRREDIAKEKSSETSIKRPTNILVLILGIVFLVVAIGLVSYFGYTKIVKTTFEPVTVPASFLFIFDKDKFIDTAKEKREIYIDVEKNIADVSQLQDKTFTELVFFKTDSNTKENIRLTSSEFFDLYDISLPTNIARSISKDFVYGMYRTEGRTEPFLVVGLTDYESMYAGMFVWESTLALDIKDIFPYLKNLFTITKETNRSSTQEIATTSSSSTAPVVSATTTETLAPEQEFQNQDEARQAVNRTIRFIDLVFSNRSVRAARDEKGTPFFYYGFINRDKIIFAQDPMLIGEISQKIKEKSLVR